MEVKYSYSVMLLILVYGFVINFYNFTDVVHEPSFKWRSNPINEYQFLLIITLLNKDKEVFHSVYAMKKG